jgi:hypothetical protein
VTAAEWNTLQACELEDVATAALDAGDWQNFRRMVELARARWAAVGGACRAELEVFIAGRF